MNIREIPEVVPDEIDEAMIAEAEKENTEELYELEDVKQMFDSLQEEERMDIPKFMTIRQVAKTGFITEHWLRKLVAQNRVPGIYVGKRFMVNFDLFVEQLNRDSMDIVQGGQ